MKRNISKFLTVLMLLICSIFTLTSCSFDWLPWNKEPQTEIENPDVGEDDGGEPSDDNGEEENDNRAYWIAVDYENVDLFAGEQFTVTATLMKGSAIIENTIFEWLSMDTSVATVEDGVVSALKAGTCEIKVKAAVYENIEATITVNANAALTMDMSMQSLELAKLEVGNYTTTQDVTFDVKWQGESVTDATVNVRVSNDKVSAVLNGQAITVTANEIGDSVITATCIYNGVAVESYVNVSVVKPLIEAGETYLFSSGKQNTIDLSLIEEAVGYTAADVISVSADDKIFPIENQESSIVTISNTSSLGNDGTVTTKLVVELSTIRLGLNVKGYTHVIRSAKDFDYMKNFLVDTNIAADSVSGLTKTKQIQGYYILANDIDFAEEYPDGYSSPFSYPDVGYTARGWDNGWNATFDGNGHVISNLKLIKSTTPAGVWCNSLFGVIAGGGKVKNVAFKNCSIDAALKDSTFFASVVYGAIENVYIEVTDNSSANNALFIGYGNSPTGLTVNTLGTTYAETKISNVTLVVRGTVSAGDYVMRGFAGGLNAIKDSIIIIGMPETNILMGNKTDNSAYDTLAELQALNSNIQVYASVLAATEDETLTICGSATFARDPVKYTISWYGQEVLTEILETTKLAQINYSLDDKTIDFEKLGITVNEETVFTRNGMPVQFTLDGQVATITGDTVLNGNPQDATGAVEELVIITSTAAYSLPLKVCSDIIYTAADFDAMKRFLVETTTASGDTSKYGAYCKQIKGYYILANDINFAEGYSDGYSSPFSYPDVGYKDQGWTHGWSATFDGNGHVISNLKLIKSTTPAGVWCNSLFGLVAGDGVIKNVAFKNCSLDASLRQSAFLASALYGTVENVYAEITDNGTVDNAILIGYGTNGGVKEQSYVSISNVTVVVHNLSAGSYVFRAAKTECASSIKGAIVVIGAEAASVFQNVASNANISAYTNESNVSVTTCGSTTFATVDNKFIVSWYGKEIYSKTLLV